MPEIHLVHSYDGLFFAGSVALAAFGGYVALWLIGRVPEMEGTGHSLHWLAAASAAMGVGIWCMHFTGMLALRLPVPMGYEPGLTLLSVAIAVVASLLAFAVIRRDRVTECQVAAASALMGAAIAGMHYTGMAAMRIPGEMVYLPGVVVASVGVAVLASWAALRIFLNYRDRDREFLAWPWKEISGGAVLGLAVSGLHYTAMAAVRFRDFRPEAPLPGSGLLLTEGLDVWVTVGGVALLGLGLAAALLDRRLHLAVAAEVRESRRRYETLLTEISDTVSVMDENGTIRYQSPSVERLFGYESHERVGRSGFEKIHPEDRQEVREAFARTLERAEGTTVQYRLRHADGSWRQVESTSVVPEESDLGAMVVVTRDITDRVQVQQKYRAIFETSPSAVGISSLEDGRFVDVNPAFERLVGRSREEVIGSSSGELGLWARPEQRERIVERIVETGSVHNTEVEFRDAEGETVHVLFSGSLLELGRERYFLGIAQDIRERKEFEATLEWQALHDQLTGLPSRSLFQDRLDHALERVERTREEVAVLFLDLDQFKAINDSLGHGAGDRALQLVAERLTDALRDEDTVARVGGDEFAVVLESLSSPADLEEAVSRIRRAFEGTFEVEGTTLSLSASIGVAHSGMRFEEPEDLVRLADAAMYEVKGTDRPASVEGREG